MKNLFALLEADPVRGRELLSRFVALWTVSTFSYHRRPIASCHSSQDCWM